jgi:hypothetical protein
MSVSVPAAGLGAGRQSAAPGYLRVFGAKDRRQASPAVAQRLLELVPDVPSRTQPGAGPSSRARCRREPAMTHTMTSPGRHPDASSYGQRAAAQTVPHSDTRRLPDSGELAQVVPFVAAWPLKSFLELGALPGAVPCARLHARQVLWEWHLGTFGESTALLVSELVTNAVRISRECAPDSPVRLWLVSDTTQVVVVVWDASPLPPVRIDADDDAENGRGLMLVDAVSERWGWDFPHGIGGKAVWAQAAPSEPRS